MTSLEFNIQLWGDGTPRANRLWKFAKEFRGNNKPGWILSYLEAEELAVMHPDIWAEYEDWEVPGL